MGVCMDIIFVVPRTIIFFTERVTNQELPKLAQNVAKRPHQQNGALRAPFLPAFFVAFCANFGNSWSVTLSVKSSISFSQLGLPSLGKARLTYCAAVRTQLVRKLAPELQKQRSLARFARQIALGLAVSVTLLLPQTALDHPYDYVKIR